MGVVDPTKLKQDSRVLWKLMNQRDCVWENQLPNRHEDRMAGKRSKFITALQFGSQIYSYASSYENSCSESSGGQGMGNIGENFGVEPDESQK